MRPGSAREGLPAAGVLRIRAGVLEENRVSPAFALTLSGGAAGATADARATGAKPEPEE